MWHRMSQCWVTQYVAHSESVLCDPYVAQNGSVVGDPVCGTKWVSAGWPSMWHRESHCLVTRYVSWTESVLCDSVSDTVQLVSCVRLGPGTWWQAASLWLSACLTLWAVMDHLDRLEHTLPVSPQCSASTTVIGHNDTTLAASTISVNPMFSQNHWHQPQ